MIVPREARDIGVILPEVAIADYKAYESARRAGGGSVSIGKLAIDKVAREWAVAETVDQKARSGLELLTSVAQSYNLGSPWQPFSRLEKQALAAHEAFCRDHTLHTVRVFLLSYATDPNSGELLQAALLHDIGFLSQHLGYFLRKDIADPYSQIFEELTGAGAPVDIEFDILPVLASGIYFWLNRMSLCGTGDDLSPSSEIACLLSHQFVRCLPDCIAGRPFPGSHAFISASLYLKAALRPLLGQRPFASLVPSRLQLVGLSVDELHKALVAATLILYHDFGMGKLPPELRDAVSHRLPCLVAADEIADWGRSSTGEAQVVLGVRDWELRREDRRVVTVATFVCNGPMKGGTAERVAETVLKKVCNLVRAGVDAIDLCFTGLAVDARDLQQAGQKYVEGCGEMRDAAGTAFEQLNLELEATDRPERRGGKVVGDRSQGANVISEVKFHLKNGEGKWTLAHPGPQDEIPRLPDGTGD